MLTLARPDDADALLTLYRREIGRPGCTWDEDYPNRGIALRDLARQDVYCLRDGEGRLYAAVTAAREEELSALPCWTLRPAHPREIARLAVAPEAQGHGLAASLLTELFGLLGAQGCDGLRLLVSPDNAAALKTYARLGCTVCGSCEMYDQHWLACEMALTCPLAP